jgi:hypothetical protein
MINKKLCALFLIAVASITAAVVYVNYQALSEAFGVGAPYYSKTVNMDKWEDPTKFLVVLDVAALIVNFFLLKRAVRYWRDA